MKIILLLWLCAVVATDFQFRRVFNHWILFGVFLAVLQIIFFQRDTWLSHIGASLGLFLFFLLFYQKKMMAAGDVKFFAVLGLWFGISMQLLEIVLLGTVLAGTHALWMLSVRRLQLTFALPLVQRMYGDEGNRQSRGIPYAGYLAVAAIGQMLLASQRG